MKLLARLKTNTHNSVTLWDPAPGAPQWRGFVRLEVIADGGASVLYIDRESWGGFATASLPPPEESPPPKRRRGRPKAPPLEPESNPETT